ncbi:MAG: hypothetical protein EXQ56_00355 [Acidobacteria bacterium]|nr:hypothetical protein [Acidobacteriota bacterium]
MMKKAMNSTNLSRILILLLLTERILLGQESCLQQSVPVGVIDSRGELVAGLDISSFRGEFRGKPVEIKSAMIDHQPRRILMLLDVSGSITLDHEIWNFAVQAAADAIRELTGGNALALASFSTGFRTQMDF